MIESSSTVCKSVLPWNGSEPAKRRCRLDCRCPTHHPCCQGRVNRHEFLPFLCRPTDLCGGAVDYHPGDRADLHPQSADQRVPGCGATLGGGAYGLSGANPKEIAETVATPLEEAINGVEDLMYFKSVAGSDGVLQMTVTFRPGTDAEEAAVRVQNRVSQAEARLPEAVRRQGVTTQKQSPTFLMVVHLTSPRGRIRHPLSA